MDEWPCEKNKLDFIRIEDLLAGGIGTLVRLYFRSFQCYNFK